MCNAVQQCLAANNILLMRKENRAFLLLAIALAWKMADLFASQGYSLKKQTRWSNDKTIIALGYRKISSIDLLATDKSRYFGQPRPIIVNYLHDHTNAYSIAKAILREKRTNISSQDN